MLKVERVTTGGHSVRSLVDSIIEAGAERYRLLALLAEIDLTLQDLETCEDIKFWVSEERLYEVNEQFPRIVSTTFQGEHLPNGVVDINYRIDLTLEPPMPLDGAATEAIFRKMVRREFDAPGHSSIRPGASKVTYPGSASWPR